MHFYALVINLEFKINQASSLTKYLKWNDSVWISQDTCIIYMLKTIRILATGTLISAGGNANGIATLEDSLAA